MFLKPKIAPHIIEIVAELQKAGYEALIVGGAVRDFLLDRQPKDYDISTSATPEEVKKVFRKRHAVIIGKRFRLVHLYCGDEIIEISTFRRKPEHIEIEGAKKNAKYENAPENMIFRDNEFGTAQEDALRRDFTINALFYDPVNDKIYDHTGMGEEDIRNGIVRAIGEPKTRMEEDPVRILRALKLVGQYNFRMEENTLRAVTECMELIKLASDSRMTLEMEKILKSPYGDRVAKAFHEYGFLRYFLPGLESIWETPDGEYVRDLWKIRNERILSGDYRESISLAMSLISLPASERMLSAHKKSIHPDWDMYDLVAAILKPRCPTKRALAAAARTLLMQKYFDDPTEENVEKAKKMRGYAHARELALLRRKLAETDLEVFAEIWPKGDPGKKHAFPFRRPKRRHAPERGKNSPDQKEREQA